MQKSTKTHGACQNRTAACDPAVDPAARTLLRNACKQGEEDAALLRAVATVDEVPAAALPGTRVVPGTAAAAAAAAASGGDELASADAVLRSLSCGVSGGGGGSGSGGYGTAIGPDALSALQLPMSGASLPDSSWGSGIQSRSASGGGGGAHLSPQRVAGLMAQLQQQLVEVYLPLQSTLGSEQAAAGAGGGQAGAASSGGAALQAPGLAPHGRVMHPNAIDGAELLQAARGSQVSAAAAAAGGTVAPGVGQGMGTGVGGVGPDRRVDIVALVGDWAQRLEGCVAPLCSLAGQPVPLLSHHSHHHRQQPQQQWAGAQGSSYPPVSGPRVGMHGGGGAPLGWPLMAAAAPLPASTPALGGSGVPGGPVHPLLAPPHVSSGHAALLSTQLGVHRASLEALRGMERRLVEQLGAARQRAAQLEPQALGRYLSTAATRAAATATAVGVAAGAAATATTGAMAPGVLVAQGHRAEAELNGAWTGAGFRPAESVPGVGAGREGLRETLAARLDAAANVQPVHQRQAEELGRPGSTHQQGVQGGAQTEVWGAAAQQQHSSCGGGSGGALGDVARQQSVGGAALQPWGAHPTAAVAGASTLPDSAAWQGVEQGQDVFSGLPVPSQHPAGSSAAAIDTTAHTGNSDMSGAWALASGVEVQGNRQAGSGAPSQDMVLAQSAGVVQGSGVSSGWSQALAMATPMKEQAEDAKQGMEEAGRVQQVAGRAVLSADAPPGSGEPTAAAPPAQAGEQGAAVAAGEVAAGGAGGAVDVAGLRARLAAQQLQQLQLQRNTVSHSQQLQQPPGPGEATAADNAADNTGTPAAPSLVGNVSGGSGQDKAETRDVLATADVQRIKARLALLGKRVAGQAGAGAGQPAAADAAAAATRSSAAAVLAGADASAATDISDVGNINVPAIPGAAAGAMDWQGAAAAVHGPSATPPAAVPNPLLLPLSTGLPHAGPTGFEAGAAVGGDAGSIWAMEIDSPDEEDIGAVLLALGCSPKTRAGLGSVAPGARVAALRASRLGLAADAAAAAGQPNGGAGAGAAGAPPQGPGTAGEGGAGWDAMQSQDALQGQDAVQVQDQQQVAGAEGLQTAAAKGPPAQPAGQFAAGFIPGQGFAAFSPDVSAEIAARRLTFSSAVSLPR